MKKFTYQQVRDESLVYFDGDDLAAEVFAGKYALQDLSGDWYESSPDDMHKRLATDFARIEQKYPNPLTYDEIYNSFSNWDIVAQGSPMSAIGNPFQYQSLSNCFVIRSPYDSIGGIFKTTEELAQIMKRRGGVGFDISTIRPKGVETANAARTTDGIGVFMEQFSTTTRGIAQGGRRGALMLTISVHHPEIRTFINIKRDKKKVTGANISIRLTDEFMNAVKNEQKVQLRFPVDPDAKHTVTEYVDAKELWHEIISAAHESAEPGLLFWDTVHRRGPADIYRDFLSTSTNPCVSGDTLIATADGRNAVSIKQLAEEGKDVPVYSTDTKTGQVQIKWGRNPRLTKKGVEVWKLTLDDGSSLIATPDHKILLRDGTYVELQDLKFGMSIFPFNSFDSNRYRQVCKTGAVISSTARRNRRQYRLIHEFYHGLTDSKNNVVHHIDFDSKNDNIENLRMMSRSEHEDLHAKLMMGENNPYHKMSAEWKFKFAYHPGVKNGRYSGHTNEQILAAGRSLFEKHGKLTPQVWTEHARKTKMPIHLANEFRFGTWQNFVNQVSNNHKVVSVEKFGIEDVYNITVDDNHNYHVITSFEDEKYVTSSGICVKNCGEICLSPYDSCRLLLVNLANFVNDPFTDHAKFDYPRFAAAVQIAQKLMDDLVDLELEAVDKIIKKIESDPEPDDVKYVELSMWHEIKRVAIAGRRTGLGITALGDTLAYLGIKYGSDESVETTGKIYKHLAFNAYRMSVDMARDRGAFPVFDHDLEKGHEFIEQIMSLDDDLRDDYNRYGRRNIALTTTAPAGSVSILTQTTSGCEPAFLTSYKRRRKINPGDAEARVDFVDALGDKWQEYIVYHPGFKKWMDVTGETDPQKSPYWGATSNDINWVKKIDVQAAAQKWICHAISNTTNIPNDTSIDVVKDIYMRGWETGCKGVTIYRDGSRDGVLVKDSTPDPEGREMIIETHAPKRSKELECDIHRAVVKGVQYLVFVGLMDGRPYEIFAGLSEHVEVPRKATRGYLVKNGKKSGVTTYNLRIEVEGEAELLFKDIVDLFDNPVYGAFTRTLSLALRHGVPVQYLVEQLRKDKHSDVTSFSSVIARVLGKSYIADGTVPVHVKSCPKCGSTSNLRYEQGCVTCFDCGNSKCSLYLELTEFSFHETDTTTIKNY